MGVKYDPATPDMIELAKKLRDAHHTHLNDYDVRVDYFRSDRRFTKYGVVMPGVAALSPNLWAYIANSGRPFFAVAICGEWYDSATPIQREAEMDRCLSMLGADEDEHGDAKLFLNAPDFVAWHEHYERYQKTDAKLKDLLPVYDPQLDLFEAEAAQAAGAADGEGDELTDAERETQRRLLRADANDGSADGEEEDEESTQTPATVRSFLDRDAAREYGASDADLVSAHAGGGNPLRVVTADMTAARGTNGNGQKRSGRAARAAAVLGEGVNADADTEGTGDGVAGMPTTEAVAA